MSISYRSNIALDTNKLQELFLSVEWDSGNYPEKLSKAITGSTSVFTAWDNEQLVGLINVLSDGSMAAYVHYLLVRPEYQSQGIGKALVNMVVEEYADVPHKVLVAYNSEVGFYERCGFDQPNNTCPMFMTSMQI